MNGSALAMKRRALERAQPLNVHLELTYRCNWRCVFCYNPRHSDRQRLSGEEWISLLDDLRALGTLTVTLTGGEPLTHPDFFRILAAARTRSFAVRIFSNATLVDDEAADEIARAFPLAVEVSIHGASAAVHDAATARPGSFEQTLAGIDRLRARGVPVVLKTPLTSINEHEIEAIIALAEERELTVQIDPHLTPRDDGDSAPTRFTASQAAIRRVMELGADGGSVIPTERNRGGYNCGLGRITMAIDPEGNVYPCLQWRQAALGNVREASLIELWRTSPVRAAAAEVAVAANDRLLDLGPPYSTFSFCPALAYEATGDPLEPDPSFRARAAIAAEVRERMQP